VGGRDLGGDRAHQRHEHGPPVGGPSRDRGQERGQDFAARDCDVAFIIPQDPRPEALKRQVDQYRDLARERYGKEIQVWMSSYVVQRDTMDEARAYVQDYVVTRGDREGVDAFLDNNVGNAHTFP
jgi:alkanesulfonate monooxygenase SsuD/methylene tetrahydromethanopterin reductase-like flavin-dependent oxidoreductase (luciferase family)